MKKLSILAILLSCTLTQSFASSCFSSSHNNATSAKISCNDYKFSYTLNCPIGKAAYCSASCKSGNLTTVQWSSPSQDSGQIYQNSNGSWTVQTDNVNNYNDKCSVSYF